MQIPDSPQDQVALLAQRIGESGLSLTKYAERVLLRDARTVRRWIAGSSPISNHVLPYLAEPWDLNPPGGEV